MTARDEDPHKGMWRREERGGGGKPLVTTPIVKKNYLYYTQVISYRSSMIVIVYVGALEGVGLLIIVPRTSPLERVPSVDATRLLLEHLLRVNKIMPVSFVYCLQ